MKKLLFLLPLLLPGPALADGETARLDDGFEDRQLTLIVIGTRTRVDQSGQAISILGVEDVRAAQGADLTRLLERVPGLLFSRNGGTGSFTGVRLRGSESEQVLVLMDGIRVEDVSSPSGGFDFATLSPGEIERIDILRGSNSVPWGSAAMGGVIAITSRALSGVEGRVEYGSLATFTADGAAGLSSDAGAVSLSGGYRRSDGVSAAAAGNEADGFSSWHVGGRARLNLAPGLRLVASARHADTRTDIDGYGPPTYTFGDTPEFQKTRQTAGYAGVDYEASGMTVSSGVALAHTGRAYFDPTYSSDPSYSYGGRSVRWDLNGAIALQKGLALHFGADREWTRFSSTFDAEARSATSSIHGQLSREWSHGALAVGVRWEDHDTFGSNWSAGANGTFSISERLRIRASFGEGFKAPTLFQLLSDYGNAGLKPETSRSFDLGFDFGGAGQPVSLAATFYRRDSKNLIAYVSCASLGRCVDRPFGLYDNIARARAQGLELQATARPLDELELQAVYTFTETENRTAGSTQRGNQLARRPRHAATFVVDWRLWPGGPTFGGDMRWVGASYDDASNTIRIGSYALVALRTSMAVTDAIELYGRVENLFDQSYETAAGYGSWGRSVFLGVRTHY